MKQKLTIIFFFGAFIFVIAGIINYNVNTSSLTVYEELGSDERVEFIDLEKVLTDFQVNDIEGISSSDMTVIYLTNYSECANTIVEIKEFNNLMDSVRVASGMKIAEVFLLLDDNSERAQRELKIFNLDYQSGFSPYNDNADILTRFGESDLSTNQIIFVDEYQEIRFRNKLSGQIDSPIEAKKSVIDLGIRHAL